MRIVVANHHLYHRAGSELFTKELAIGLRDAGHEVGVFTFAPGAISAEIQAAGIPVWDTRHGAEIEAFRPDVLHTHHAPCLAFLASLELECAAVHGVLGVLPAIEEPPLVFDGVARALVVSEEVGSAIGTSDFGRAVPIHVFRNWFPGEQPPRPRPRVPRPIRRVVVVTNHLDPVLARHLEEIRVETPGFTWEHVGLPNHSRPVTATTLSPYDLVVTIGRGALLAGSLGIPCLLYDTSGCDGLLRAEALAELASHNFSGRLTASRPSRAELAHLLLEAPASVDLVATAEAIHAGFSLGARVAEATRHYEDAIASGVRLGASTRARYGRHGVLHGEVVGTSNYYRYLNDTFRARFAPLLATRTTGTDWRRDYLLLRAEVERAMRGY